MLDGWHRVHAPEAMAIASLKLRWCALIGITMAKQRALLCHCCQPWPGSVEIQVCYI